MASGSDFVLKLIDRVTAPARAMAKALAGMREAQKSVRATAAAAQVSVDQLGNAAVKAGAKATAGAAGIDKLARAQQRAAAKAAKVSAGGGSHVSEARGVRDVAAWVTTSVAKAALLAAAAGAAATIWITKMVVTMGAFAERSKRAFTFLTGSKALGAEAFEAGRKLAQEFNLDVEETVKQLIKLRAMQFSMPEAIELTKLSADLQAISGDSEAAGRALTAITQIKAKGKLQSEELVGQLAEAGVSTVLVYEQLEKSLGKSRKQVLAQLQAGAIDAETGIAAIKAAILHKIGTEEAGAAGKAFARETLSGMWQGLAEAPKLLALNISQFVNLEPLRQSVSKLMAALNGVNSHSVGDFVNNMISGLAKALDIAVAFGEGFSEGFRDIRQAMGMSMDVGPIIDFAREAGKWIAGFVADTIRLVKVVVATFQYFGPELKLAWDIGRGAFELFFVIVGRILNPVGFLHDKIVGIVDSLKELFGLLGKKVPVKVPLGVPGLPIDPRLRQGVGPLINQAPLVDAGTPRKRTIAGRIAAPAVQVNRIEITVSSADDPKSVGEAAKRGLMDALEQFGSRALAAAI